MLYCVVDAMDNQDFATTNISGTFFKTKMEGIVQVKLYGILDKMLLEIDPENT